MPLKIISPSVLPADAIQDAEVDWGTGTGQVNAGDIPDEGATATDKVILTKADKDKIHTQGTDTSLGTQASNLDMGGQSIDDINVVNQKALCCTVHNNTGSTLSAGIGVYPTGEVGGVVTVAKCDNTDKDKMPCLGVISSDITDGSDGCAVCRGIKGMNTSGFTGNPGDRVYMKSDGTLDTVEPTSGTIQRIGILVVKDASGKIYVHSRGRKSISATADEHPIARMGNDVGHKKVSFHKYDNTEMAYIDENAVMKITSLTNGTVSTTVANLVTRVITFIIDGSGSAITTGEKGHLRIPFKCEIQRATLLADQSGSIVIDVWKDTYANFPPDNADSITSSAPPTISTATKSEDSTLTGWTKTINADDILAFNVDSCSTIERVTLTLKVKLVV